MEDTGTIGCAERAGHRAVELVCDGRGLSTTEVGASWRYDSITLWAAVGTAAKLAPPAWIVNVLCTFDGPSVATAITQHKDALCPVRTVGAGPVCAGFRAQGAVRCCSLGGSHVRSSNHRSVASVMGQCAVREEGKLIPSIPPNSVSRDSLRHCGQHAGGRNHPPLRKYRPPHSR